MCPLPIFTDYIVYSEILRSPLRFSCGLLFWILIACRSFLILERFLFRVRLILNLSFSFWSGFVSGF